MLDDARAPRSKQSFGIFAAFHCLGGCCWRCVVILVEKQTATSVLNSFRTVQKCHALSDLQRFLAGTLSSCLKRKGSCAGMAGVAAADTALETGGLLISRCEH